MAKHPLGSWSVRVVDYDLGTMNEEPFLLLPQTGVGTENPLFSPNADDGGYRMCAAAGGNRHRIARARG